MMYFMGAVSALGGGIMADVLMKRARVKLTEADER